MSQLRPVCLNLDQDTHEQLRELAKLEERSVSWLVRRAVRRELEANVQDAEGSSSA
jgi:predicted transcriptional regulator